MRRDQILWAVVTAVALLGAGCDDGDETEVDAGVAGDIEQTLERLVDESGAASIAVGVITDGELTTAAAAGWADVDGQRAATPQTIYGLASCSKPVVGLAAALMIQEVPEFGLDDDINDWLEWDAPLAHPSHPDAAVTLRMLLTHTSGIAGDGPADYETYPKPDPDVALMPFLRPLLADPDYWVGAPGAGEEYSNLGVALAALVIQEATGEDFRAFCESRIFEPLDMPDTRWFYGDLSAAQKARHAIPYDPDGEPYEIYAFNDYPSGLLRTTIDDFSRLMIALADGGELDGAQAVSAAAVEAFHGVPMLIEASDAAGGTRQYDHSGGESGVTTYFTYRDDGRGYLYLINTDLDDDASESLEAELESALKSLAGLP